MKEINTCLKCVSCEAIEYIKPYHIVYECRQADILLNDLQLAEGCRCFEKTEDMSVGGIWKLDKFWKNELAEKINKNKTKIMKQNCNTCGWGRELPDVKIILECGCPLCGCYRTDVMLDDGKKCDTWKKASDYYLKAIGEIK